MIEWVRVVLMGVTGLVSAVDGDTIRMGDGSLVRLKGGNTPELASKCPTPEGRARERARAVAAATRLNALLKGRKVTLVIMPETCGHGRHCGHLVSDGRDAMTVLIAEGKAEPMECPSGKCPPPKDWCADDSD